MSKPDNSGKSANIGDARAEAPTTSSPGKPVVATRHAGIPEAVVDGETGYLVDEGDTLGMAERLCEIASDVESAIALGRAGRERVRSFYSRGRQLASLRSLMNI